MALTYWMGLIWSDDSVNLKASSSAVPMVKSRGCRCASPRRPSGRPPCWRRSGAARRKCPFSGIRVSRSTRCRSATRRQQSPPPWMKEPSGIVASTTVVLVYAGDQAQARIDAHQLANVGASPSGRRQRKGMVAPTGSLADGVQVAMGVSRTDQLPEVSEVLAKACVMLTVTTVVLVYPVIVAIPAPACARRPTSAARRLQPRRSACARCRRWRETGCQLWPQRTPLRQRAGAQS